MSNSLKVVGLVSKPIKIGGSYEMFALWPQVPEKVLVR
jgi:hypothetical protein